MGVNHVVKCFGEDLGEDVAYASTSIQLFQVHRLTTTRYGRPKVDGEVVYQLKQQPTFFEKKRKREKRLKD